MCVCEASVLKVTVHRSYAGFVKSVDIIFVTVTGRRISLRDINFFLVKVYFLDAKNLAFILWHGEWGSLELLSKMEYWGPSIFIKTKKTSEN